MDDLISRQAAIDIVYRQRFGMQKMAFDIIMEKLSELPSAQSEPKWIPVTERLPEESDGTVLVCMPDESPYNEQEPFINAKHNQQVETATYSQHSDTWYFAMGAVSSARPIAWMPLPEPYRKETEDADIH